MRTSLIVTTYNRPDALHVVLQSVLRQSQLPDEVIIADDGSGEATRMLIASLQHDFPVPLVHVWQEDLGFRAARIRNLAASKAQGDYVVFIDGDMMLHRRFLDSHVRAAREKWMLHGKRAMLRTRRI
jgi:glycosyltransferase involved in cell wall biosynthesis